MSANPSANLNYLYNTFQQAKSSAAQTEAGMQLKEAQNNLKKNFFDFCSDNSGWNKTSINVPASAMKKFEQWSEKRGIPSDRYTPFSDKDNLELSAYRYHYIRTGVIKHVGHPTVEEAKRAKKAFKEAVIYTIKNEGEEKVKRVLAQAIQKNNKLLCEIESWAKKI